MNINRTGSEIRTELQQLKIDIEKNPTDEKTISRLAERALKSLGIKEGYKDRFEKLMKKLHEGNPDDQAIKLAKEVNFLIEKRLRNQNSSYKDYSKNLGMIASMQLNGRFTRLFPLKDQNTIRGTMETLLSKDVTLEEMKISAKDAKTYLEASKKVVQEIYKIEQEAKDQDRELLGEGAFGTVYKQQHLSECRKILSHHKHFQIQLLFSLIEEGSFDSNDPDQMQVLGLLKPLFVDSLNIEQAKKDFGLEGETLPETELKDLLFYHFQRAVIEKSSITDQYIKQMKAALANYRSKKAESLEQERFFAIKVERDQQIPQEGLSQEIALSMRIPRHPNVSRIKPLTETSAMGVADEGLTYQKVNEYTPERRKKCLMDAARGLTAVHQAGVIHGDLKLENLLRKEERFLISDFGFSRQMNQDGEKYGDHEDPKPLRYVAPEVISQDLYSEKSDIFSLGMLFYELIEETSPFNESSPIDAANKIYREETPDTSPEKIAEKLGLSVEKALKMFQLLYDKMLHPSPDKRLTAKEVLKELKEIFSE